MFPMLPGVPGVPGGSQLQFDFIPEAGLDPMVDSAFRPADDPPLQFDISSSSEIESGVLDRPGRGLFQPVAQGNFV